SMIEVLIRLLPQMLVNGLTIGAVYALIALGYTMVYGVLQLINFAHGELFMLGAMSAVFVLTAMGITAPLPFGLLLIVLVVIFIISMAFSAALGVTTERLAYKPLRQASRLSPLISALGVSIALQNGTMIVVSPAPQFLPNILETSPISVFGLATIQNKQIIILVVAAALMFALHWLVNYTLFGMSVRAVAEDKDAASLMGIDIDRVISSVFIIGPGLGAAAGILFSMYYGVT